MKATAVWNVNILVLLAVGASASASAARHASSARFDYAAHLGNLAPYRKAPVPSGVEETLPDDCKVEQVMLMHRHGSRYPLASELESITGLVTTLAHASAAIQRARLPAALAFLKHGYRSTLGHDDLTAPGRMQLFEHGVRFRLMYPHLRADTVLAGLQDRVVESAQWFAQGYFGREWATLNQTAFETIPEDSATPSWITPMNTCKDWQYDYGNNATIEWGRIYLPLIAKRLNRMLPGVNLSVDNVHGALYACAYDLAALGTSPWCDVFTASEIEDFEYELDLLMDGAFGYNLPAPMGQVLGGLFVKKLVERFTNSTGEAKSVYLEFGHDTTIDLALTALGLAEDSPPISAKGPARRTRKFRTSHQVPFAAQMVWEKFTCASLSSRARFGAGPQVRLVLNDAVFPLATCERVERKYGSCALEDFVASNEGGVGHAWGDARWNGTCGDAGI